MYEGDTFKSAIDRIKVRYCVKRVVIVADSGLLSKQNIELLEKENLDYILGARLRSLSDQWQERILDNTGYEKVQKDGEVLRIATYSYSNKRRLIVTHNTKRAEKDRKDREKAVEKLRQKLEKSKNPKSLISNYGYKKFLSVDGEVQVQVDEEKLQKEALWDGLHGIMTNTKDKDMKPEEALSHYHGLWQVEDSFRIEKHDIRVPPVFHWTSRRIKAHIAICFLAFALIRFVQYKIKQKTGEHFSAERIREELYRIQDSVLISTVDNQKYVIPSKPGKDAVKIYEVYNKKRHVIPFRLTAEV
jgi:transposase